MEKKGELLNQLAIISDLIEKVNLTATSQKLVFDLSDEEFDKTFETIQKKYGRRMDKPKSSFNITIGLVDIIFNRNSV